MALASAPRITNTTRTKGNHLLLRLAKLLAPNKDHPEYKAHQSHVVLRDVDVRWEFTLCALKIPAFLRNVCTQWPEISQEIEAKHTRHSKQQSRLPSSSKVFAHVSWNQTKKPSSSLSSYTILIQDIQVCISMPTNPAWTRPILAAAFSQSHVKKPKERP